MIIIEQMENTEYLQDFTGSTDSVLINSDEVLIKSGTTQYTATGRKIGDKKLGRPKKEKEPELSPMESAFVDAYLNPACGYNSKTAAMKAGHIEKGSTDYGIKLMNDIRILRCIELRRKMMTVAVATTRIDMLRKIEAFLAIAMEKKDPTGAARLLSLEIGMLGFNEPVKMDITGSINLSFGSGEVIIASKNPARYDDAQDVTDITNDTEEI